ncbi:helix-hairpin-helix domain-containing protein [Haloechinothrix sp. YIM 98757]|uniref:Helix-hairpin-helix domain-containing protein n=1 Tax=Haloechinothrix aidingensis TaxID=2752311 RepID=A0A838AD20_9PSEU|nr:helix-hairpin-helix domain-containing protein [Haloechinothrix aidingensis]MBA0127130.1 helix-hairpin-helix domain-containing protein [Haloechinothrix aidingensis]
MTMQETGDSAVAWYKRRRTLVVFVVVAFFAGVLAGGATTTDGTAGSGTELEIAELTGEWDEVAQALGVDTSATPEELAARIEDLNEDLSRREDRLAQRADELAERESELDTRAEELAERESELDAREEELAEQQDTGPPPEDEPDSSGGCRSDQVDINTASHQALQRIHEIGPERAEQVVNLRPFSSVDDLTRVSGIAEGRLGGIKNQGLACVD